MTCHPVAPETPAGLDAMREAVAAVEAAMASCEADGHKCACRQFGWQFDAEAHQCSARLSGARSAIRAADGPLASVMRERDEARAEAERMHRHATERHWAWDRTNTELFDANKALRAAKAELASVTRERDRLVALVSSSEAERYRSCSELLDRALAAEAELATLKAAARDGEAARQEIERLRAALKLAENPLSYRNATEPNAPGSHAVARALEAVRAALNTTETRDA